MYDTVLVCPWPALLLVLPFIFCLERETWGVYVSVCICILCVCGHWSLVCAFLCVCECSQVWNCVHVWMWSMVHCEVCVVCVLMCSGGCIYVLPHLFPVENRIAKCFPQLRVAWGQVESASFQGNVILQWKRKQYSSRWKQYFQEEEKTGEKRRKGEKRIRKERGEEVKHFVCWCLFQSHPAMSLQLFFSWWLILFFSSPALPWFPVISCSCSIVSHMCLIVFLLLYMHSVYSVSSQSLLAACFHPLRQINPTFFS